LIELFGRKSFAFVFVLLLAVPALPLPTGGATHVFEIVAVLLAGQLIAGREEIWGVVVLSLGVLLEDVLVVALGLILGAGGIVLEIVIGSAAIHGISRLV
jgi:hypothetical protein